MGSYKGKIYNNKTNEVIDNSGEIDFTEDSSLSVVYKNSNKNAKYKATLAPTSISTYYNYNNKPIYIVEPKNPTHVVAVLVSLNASPTSMTPRMITKNWEWKISAIAVTGDMNNCRIYVDIDDNLLGTYYAVSPSTSSTKPSGGVSDSNRGYYETYKGGLHYSEVTSLSQYYNYIPNAGNGHSWVANKNDSKIQSELSNCKIIQTSGNFPDGAQYAGYSDLMYSRWTSPGGKPDYSDNEIQYTRLAMIEHADELFTTQGPPKHHICNFTFKIFQKQSNGTEKLLDTTKMSFIILADKNRLPIYQETTNSTRDLKHYIYNGQNLKITFAGGLWHPNLVYNSNTRESFADIYAQGFWLLADDYKIQ